MSHCCQVRGASETHHLSTKTIHLHSHLLATKTTSPPRLHHSTKTVHSHRFHLYAEFTTAAHRPFTQTTSPQTLLLVRSPFLLQWRSESCPGCHDNRRNSRPSFDPVSNLDLPIGWEGFISKSSYDLVMATVYSKYSLSAPPKEVGETIPSNTPHAVSTTLPTWKSNVAYEEGEHWVTSKMKSAYPR
jgi:hypothetical protein